MIELQLLLQQMVSFDDSVLHRCAELLVTDSKPKGTAKGLMQSKASYAGLNCLASACLFRTQDVGAVCAVGASAVPCPST